MSGLRIILMVLVSLCLLACSGDDVATGTAGGGDEIPADCQGGVCICPGSLVVCQQGCVDLATDFDNCGECGESCGNGRECLSGVCVNKVCGTGELACEGECVDVSRDPNFCGRCDRQCFAGEQCVSGQCVCPQGQVDCEQVGNSGAIVGGACRGDAECSPGSRCLMDGDFPGGTCSVVCNDHTDCPEQTACVDAGGGVCLLLCNSDSDCREDYDCNNVDNVSGGGESEVCIDE